MLVLHDASSGVKGKWRQILESIQREIGMTQETLGLKKQFSAGFGAGGGGGIGTMKKQTATERMPVNIISSSDNVMIQPIVPLPNQGPSKR